jgi:pimeloyl-ACP methyl ester carboxylesterase
MSALIFYVHGAHASDQSFNYIRYSLHGEFADQTFSYDLRSATAEEIAARLLEEIIEAVEKNKIKKLILVGHSFGGVLAVRSANMLKKLNKKLRVELITLSTPFAGSKIATFIRWFNPGSKFLSNISAHDSFIKEFKVEKLPYRTTVFVTTAGDVGWIPEANDGIVTVLSQKHFESDPKATYHVVNVNHFEILLNVLVINVIRSASS